MSKLFPCIYLITPDPDKFSSLDFFLSQLVKPLSKGIRLVQLQSSMIDSERYHAIAWGVKLLCLSYDAMLILNGPALPETLNLCDGLHLNTKKLLAQNIRPIKQDKLLSATCYNEEQIRHAEKIGVDIITLPLDKEKNNDKDAWGNFAKLAFFTNIPLFASSQMDISTLSIAQKHGAYGIAGINSLWNNEIQIEPIKNGFFH